VFDSGVGGLTVLEALHQRLPHESTIYLGDLARCPYGTRPQEEVQAFAFQIGDLLVREEIKLLVVACNTATAAAYDQLRERYPLPVIGVIEPGAREAVRLSSRRRIGVVATDGTVASGAYAAAIRRQDPTMHIVERPASFLVPVLERGPLGRSAAAAELLPVLAGLRDERIDVLVLGCTHFPLARDIFEAEIGPGIAVVDSATTTANEVALLLHELDLLAPPGRVPTRRFLVTGPAEAFAERAQTMFRASPVIETVQLVLDPVP
jgi:glutamate racemase